jgi:hypothetical protein
VTSAAGEQLKVYKVWVVVIALLPVVVQMGVPEALFRNSFTLGNSELVVPTVWFM